METTNHPRPTRAALVGLLIATGAAMAAAMQWQTAAGMRFQMPEGYAFRPGTRYELDPPRSATQDVERSIEAGHPAPVGDEALRRQVRAELEAWHVQTLLVGPMPNEDQAVQYFTWVVGRQPQLIDGVYVWWDVGLPEDLSRRSACGSPAC